ncbi:NAD(P)-dependent oxidoreductase [Nonomuraea sp. NPDC003709]|uniref:NAD-dependent epimerase/dehydratase family protein n=1 Tax=Nonomuraea sp. NPDC003709 TaxID=3154450 RepID=UPI0033B7AD4F
MPDRPLVTLLGASGFIGGELARRLAARPIRLRLVSRHPAAVPQGPAQVEVVPADLRAPGVIEAAVADADAVFHLVAQISGTGAWRVAGGDEEGRAVNVGLLGRVVDALRSRTDRPVVVFTGSASQAGVDGLVSGGEPDRPSTAYDRHKVAAERLLAAASAEGAVRGITLRLPTVYGVSPSGPGKGVVAAMARRAWEDRPLLMWRDGSTMRDLLHVKDVASALLAAHDHGRALGSAREASAPWLIGTGTPIRLSNLFTAIAAAVAARSGRPPVPVLPTEPPADATPADFHSCVVDASAFTRATGWRPAATWPSGLEDVVAATAQTTQTSGT